MLISVSGIGPRSAQGILSGISIEEFKTALIHSDLHTLTSAPGVGKKTAERLVVELREKIAKTGKGEAGMPPIPVSENCEEAVLALITLGYKRPKAEQIVQRELQENDSLSVEEILRRALRRV